MDTNKLKELAERAVDDFGSFDPSEAEQEFMEQITPQDVLGLIAEVERLRGQVDHLINQHMPREPIPDMPGLTRVIDADRLKAENEVLRKDAERWRYARMILPYEAIQDAQKDFESWGGDASEFENKRCDDAIDAALQGGGR